MDKGGGEDSSTRLPRTVWRSWFIKQRDSFCMGGGSAAFFPYPAGGAVVHGRARSARAGRAQERAQGAERTSGGGGRLTSADSAGSRIGTPHAPSGLGKLNHGQFRV